MLGYGRRAARNFFPLCNNPCEERYSLAKSMADLLWHYTTGAGLRGILETNVLWATDVRYLNDESELKYALERLDGSSMRDWPCYRRAPSETGSPRSSHSLNGSRQWQFSPFAFASAINGVIS
jgi:hypothetical protein